MCEMCRDPWKVARKDFRRGGVDPEDFYAETPHRKKSKKKHVRNPCPETGKAHVYVWAVETDEYETFFKKHYGFEKFEVRVCCGCGHRGGWKKSMRLSEAYCNHFKVAPSRWAYKENSDPAYLAAREKYLRAGGSWRHLYN